MTQGRVGTHHELDVWKLAVNVTVRVYGQTDPFPLRERFGLCTQMRRAAVSIASNIAEGAARGSSLEFARFLYMARGSVAELETQTIIAKRLGYLPDERGVLEDTARLNTMLTRLIRRLKFGRKVSRSKV